MSAGPVHIAGAGLAGSLLAVLLAKRGHEVIVFERRGDMRRETVDAGRSINLALANRGIAALEMAAVMGEVREALIPMRGRMLHSVAGELSFQRYGSRDHEIIYSVSRAGLNAILMDAAEAAGAEIRFQQPAIGYDAASGELIVRAEASGRESRHAGPIFGCDGAGSPVREGLAAAGIASVTTEKLQHSYKELSIEAAADGSHRMETEALHIWPRGRHMLIALPNVDGSFTVTLFLPDEDASGPSFAALEDDAALRSFLESDFPDACALMPGIIEEYRANPVGSLGTIRTSRWHDQHALVIGDAAHAVVPFHGQGMNCAFEDCAALASVLDEIGPDWPQVFAEVEALRKANANAIADMAIENYVEMRDSVRDPGFQLRKQLEFELEARMPERFIPRYSMVMFHHLPYAEAKARGAVQADLLHELTTGKSSLEEVDLELAERLVEERLAPFDAGLDRPDLTR